MKRLARTSLSVPLLVAAGALAAAAAAASVAAPPAALADALDDSLKELKELAKSDAGKAIAKVTELEGNLDARVTDTLADIARTAKDDRLAKTAMKIAAQRKHEGLFKFVLKPKVTDKKMAEDHPDRYLAVLDSIAYYGDDAKPCRKDLEEVVRKTMSDEKQIEVAKRAVTAFAAVREPVVVETLVKWLQETDKTGGGQGGKNLSDSTKKAYAEVKPVILKCLQRLTAEDIDGGEAWAKWWKENEKGYKFPDPNASAEPDWATLTEYHDKAWGYTLKKPDGKFWVLNKNEDRNGRVKLENRDESGTLWARCNVYTEPTWGDAGNVEQFCKWFEKSFREKDFDAKFSAEPAVRELKIGGREFSVLTARGMGIGRWATWDSVERRIYVTMVNDKFLYFECAMRNGAEDALKKAFWDALEGMAFAK